MLILLLFIMVSDGILGWYIESGRYTGGDIPTNKTRFIRIGGGIQTIKVVYILTVLREFRQ